MRFLFDENLSPDLVRLLSDLFPESVHVRDVDLKSADDLVVWQYAKEKSSNHRLEGFGSPSAQLRLWASTEADLGTSGQLFDIGRGKVATP